MELIFTDLKKLSEIHVHMFEHYVQSPLPELDLRGLNQVLVSEVFQKLNLSLPKGFIYRLLLTGYKLFNSYDVSGSLVSALVDDSIRPSSALRHYLVPV